MEVFQDTGMKQHFFIFLMLYRTVQKWKEEKSSNDFTFPNGYEGTELWFQFPFKRKMLADAVPMWVGAEQLGFYTGSINSSKAAA